MENKNAIVIGGSSNIGSSMVNALVQMGYNVGFTYSSNKMHSEQMVSEIEKQGLSALALKLDLANEVEIIEVCNNFMDFFGNIDVLINNAGIFEDSLIENMKLETWERVVKVNLTGVFQCCREFVKIMKKNEYGRILNIGSVVGQTGAVGAGNYSASKSGLEGLTKSLALECARYNITVNMVALGYMDTGMGKRIPDYVKEKVIKRIPVGKFGDTNQISRMLINFVSEDAGYLTGQVIGINGGLYM